MLKKCFFCGSKNVVRNGLRGRTQRYKCKDCGRRFDGGIRRDKSQVITDYVVGKQTLEQLAVKYGVNERTIRRDLEGMRYVYKIAKYKDVTIQMDTTFDRPVQIFVNVVLVHICKPTQKVLDLHNRKVFLL